MAEIRIDEEKFKDRVQLIDEENYVTAGGRGSWDIELVFGEQHGERGERAVKFDEPEKLLAFLAMWCSHSQDGKLVIPIVAKAEEK